jgi:isopenicillin-N epimerase
LYSGANALASVMPSRRAFVKDSALLGAASLVPAVRAAQEAPASDLASAHGDLRALEVSSATLARDESHWKRVAAKYRIIKAPTNFEAGYFGMMAGPVLDAFHTHIDYANRGNSYFARTEFPALLHNARSRVAAFIGA